MSKIEWTEDTWNPTLGCSKVSAGCANCYAIRQSFRNSKFPQTAERYAGLTRKTEGGKLNWTGKVVRNTDAVVYKPLRRQKPTLYFVNSMSDLFHPEVPEEVIDEVFAIMAMCPQHTFQILTKHPERMREYLTSEGEGLEPMSALRIWEAALRLFNHGIASDYQHEDAFGAGMWHVLPLPNVWLGVSVEDQKAADERIPLLLDTPAAVRFLSCEPLLESVDISKVEGANRLDWVICGGESGHGARPIEIGWVKYLIHLCGFAGIPFFFKQWGRPEFNPDPSDPTIDKAHPDHAKGGCLLGGKLYREMPRAYQSQTV